MNILPRPSLHRPLHNLFTSRTPSFTNSLLHQQPSPTRHQIQQQPQQHQQQQTRPSSTARRHRKLLSLPPAPYLNGPPTPTGSSGRSRAALVDIPEHDHIVFTPPPSAPNVYHTPPIFLPKHDVRRALFEAAEKSKSAALRRTSGSNKAPTATTTPASKTTPSTAIIPPPTASISTSLSAATSARWPARVPLPPPVRAPTQKAYHLTPADMEEMRALRKEDEEKWTRSRLAERFQCSQLFVGMVVQASEGRVKRLEGDRRREEGRWGDRRRKARGERRKRREGWGRGE